ncbi:MAG TPA: ATP-binding protein [Thermohalobaculum sp.]|nr:ATP-binding protein [Thermohalobaculum sp.]
MMLFPVTDASQVGTVRRRALRLARERGLGEDARDRLALVVTEIGTNLMRHATEGELILAPTERDEPPGVTVVGTDTGPGLASVEKALEDGYTTAGKGRSLGGGLGAIRRLSDRFDIHSDAGGTTVTSTVVADDGAEDPDLRAAGVIVPKPGTERGGDAWAFRRGAERSLVVLLDVLGHGANAAAVAERATAAFHDADNTELERVEPLLSESLAGERGAAMVLAEISHGEGTLRALGIGNIRGEVIRGSERSGIVSAAGIAGQATRRKAVLSYPWAPGALLVLWTDGLQERGRGSEPPSLLQREPMTIAATLYRRRRRGSDDSGVVVVRAR